MDYKASIWLQQTLISLYEKKVRFSIIVFIFTLEQFGVEGVPLNQLSSLNNGKDVFSQGTIDSPDYGLASSFGGIIISIVLLFSIILVVTLCSAGCWPFNKIFRNRQPDYEGGFGNPMADTSAVGLSQIDVQALELDPVIFEPLPTLRNLSPHGGRFQTIHQTIFDSFGNGSASTGVIVPFTTDETNIYAHDWFDEPFHNFPRGNLEYFKEIGKAWFGLVIEAEARDIVPYAKKIKVLVKVLREDAGGLEQMRFLDESRLYRESDHGNVLKLLGHSIEMSPFLLIMECCPQGNLKSFLISNVTRAEMLNARGDVLRMATDIAKGLEWMASAGFTHGDLAARNCQVGSEGRILIGDYGLATQMFKDDYYWSSNIAIPLRWAAPETLHCTLNTIQTLKVTNVSNIWTFGICLWEICEFGKLPYFELNDDEVIARVILEKNYVLGHPTMPSLSMRENLCDIMKLCWNPKGEERPSMSEVVKKLERALQELQVSRRSKSEFDSKWEQLAAPIVNPNSVIPNPISSNLNNIRFSKSPNEFGKRKSVSFFGEAPIISSNIRDKSSSICPDVTNIGQTLPDSENWKDNLFSENVATNSVLPKFSDPEEEHWKKRIERGEISEKVRVKSQSVQDLMILTHVEPSDLSDPESLISVYKQQTPLMSFQSTPNSSAQQSPILRKSSSETALNSASVILGSTTSSQTVILGNSFLIPPEIRRNASTPENVSGVTTNITKPTPSPSVAINIIQPTPSPDSYETASQNPRSSKASKLKLQNNDEDNKKRYKFNIETSDPGKPPQTHHVRHTSTPIRTPSPSPTTKENVSGYENFNNSEVFLESLNGRRKSPGTLNESCPISPISKQSTEIASSQTDTGSMDNYSIVMGASDELGLKLYQTVTTVMNRTGCEEGVWEPVTGAQRKIFEGLSSESKIFNSSFDWKTESGELNPCNEQSQDVLTTTQGECDVVAESANMIEGIENYSLKNEVDVPTRRSNFNFAPRKLFIDSSGEKTGLSTLPSGSKCIPSLPAGDLRTPVSTFDQLASPTQQRLNGEGAQPVPDAEIEDFWSKQMNSLKEATGNTLALVQLGLGKDYESSKDYITQRNTKFIEDIEAAKDESESLILHDLEGETCTQTKISREAVDVDTDESEICSASKVSGMAFGGGIKEGKHFKPSEPKFKNVTESGSRQKLEDDEENENTESEYEEDHCPEFVPSMWNQNLAPAKPSIKSPELFEDSDKDEPPLVKRTTGMRKSVSFERKKTQLVYEYPPQVVSDSDEEDTKHSLQIGIGGPLALALDWELQPDELEDAQFNNEDWEEDEEDVRPMKTIKPEDVYKISGIDDNFHVRGSYQPFVFTPLPITSIVQSNVHVIPPQPPMASTSSSTLLGELRHTRDKLKLDLSRGEASVLDEDIKNQVKLDSGVGSSTSTNISPFNQCDN